MKLGKIKEVDIRSVNMTFQSGLPKKRTFGLLEKK